MYKEAPDHFRLTEELSDKEIRRLSKSENRLRRFGKVALYGLAIALSPLTIVHTDVAATMLLYPDTHPAIHDIAEPKNEVNNNKDTYFFDGLGSQNGTNFAECLTNAIQIANDSKIRAVEYGNRSVDVDGTASKIAETIREGDSVSLYGYSIGGLVALKVAIVLKSKYNIDVDEIFLDHTPMDADSVRAKMRSKAQVALNIINIADNFNLDVANSTIFRSIGDLAFGDMRYMGASTELLEDQYLVTLNANTEEDLKKIGEFRGIKPTIEYLPSADRSSDYMVDDARSEKKAVNYASANNIPIIDEPVKDAIHSQPCRTTSQYEEAARASKPALDKSRKLAAVRYHIEFGGQSRYYSTYK